MKEENKQREPYNPLDKVNLAKSVENAILSQAFLPLPPDEFTGVGIYAIYYLGDHPLYQKVGEYNRTPSSTGWPLYVGKAIPKGGRKGVFTSGGGGKSLFNRLRKHSTTIKQVTDLDLADFRCKYLTIDPIWIPLGEQLLINRYAPVWNSVVDGFGNNDPGGKRYGGKIPQWHKLHSGVGWVERMDGFGKEFDLEALKDQIIQSQEETFKKLSL